MLKVRTFSVVLLVSALPLFAQNPPQPQLKLETGMQVYKAACVACHGPHGEGMPQTTVGFEAPKTFPDFTKCDQTTPEYNRDYKAVIRDGGPGRGFSQIMPSFRDALTPEQIDMVVQTLRGFCKDKSWPRGELNFPRALVTEKAFPEDETVITTTLNAQGPPAVSEDIVYEKRFGKMNQLEISVPFEFMHQSSGAWFGGVGDVTVGMKRVLYSNLHAGSIFSLQGEVDFPTGNKARGFGTGVTTFGTFAMYGQMLPGNAFLQMQGGADLPTHPDQSPQSVYLRTALGKSFSQNRGLGRMWSPMTELIVTRDLETGAKTNWDVVPEFQVTLNRRQHIRANFGVRVPVNNTSGRPIQGIMYLLWDWFDGGLFEGWK